MTDEKKDTSKKRLVEILEKYCSSFDKNNPRDESLNIDEIKELINIIYYDDPFGILPKELTDDNKAKIEYIDRDENKYGAYDKTNGTIYINNKVLNLVSKKGFLSDGTSVRLYQIFNIFFHEQTHHVQHLRYEDLNNSTDLSTIAPALEKMYIDSNKTQVVIPDEIQNLMRIISPDEEISDGLAKAISYGRYFSLTHETDARKESLSCTVQLFDKLTEYIKTSNIKISPILKYMMNYYSTKANNDLVHYTPHDDKEISDAETSAFEMSGKKSLEEYKKFKTSLKKLSIDVFGDESSSLFLCQHKLELYLEVLSQKELIDAYKYSLVAKNSILSSQIFDYFTKKSPFLKNRNTLILRHAILEMFKERQYNDEQLRRVLLETKEILTNDDINHLIHYLIETNQFTFISFNMFIVGMEYIDENKDLFLDKLNDIYTNLPENIELNTTFPLSDEEISSLTYILSSINVKDERINKVEYAVSQHSASRYLFGTESVSDIKHQTFTDEQIKEANDFLGIADNTTSTSSKYTDEQIKEANDFLNVNDDVIKI